MTTVAWWDYRIWGDHWDLVELEVGVTIVFFWGWGSWSDHHGLVGLEVTNWARAMGGVEPSDLLWLE